MSIVYIHAFSGVAGDMLLGAFVDAGIALTDLLQELAKLKLEGYQLTAERVIKNGVTGTKVQVHCAEDHHHRGLTEITEIINNSELSDKVKQKSIEVFTVLAKAEAQVHGSTLNEVHFHEVGAIDAIVDIVGNCIALEMMNWPEIVVSPLHLGTGFVHAAHGVIPVPAPATLKILTERDIPTYCQGLRNELVTPTGAALVTALADSFGYQPQMSIAKIGYGAGTHELEIPNFTRLLVGERKKNNFQRHHHHDHDGDGKHGHHPEHGEHRHHHHH